MLVDTLGISKKLIKVGFTKEQAEEITMLSYEALHNKIPVDKSKVHERLTKVGFTDAKANVFGDVLYQVQQSMLG